MDISSLQRAYDRREPDTAEEDAYDAWFESTSFIEMLHESTINDLIQDVHAKQFDRAHQTLDKAVDAAWKQHVKDQLDEAGEARAEARWAA